MRCFSELQSEKRPRPFLRETEHSWVLYTSAQKGHTFTCMEVIHFLKHWIKVSTALTKQHHSLSISSVNKACGTDHHPKCFFCNKEVHLLLGNLLDQRMEKNTKYDSNPNSKAAQFAASPKCWGFQSLLFFFQRHSTLQPSANICHQKGQLTIANPYHINTVMYSKMSCPPVKAKRLQIYLN